MDQMSVDWPRIGNFLDFSPKRFVLINSKNNPELLLKIIRDSRFPDNADVFTHELSLTGAAFSFITREKIRNNELKAAENFEKLIIPFKSLAQDKNSRIWLGHPLLENGKLYNAYSLVAQNGVVFTHRKRFLYKTEKWLFDEPEKWQGNFENYSVLICSEASAFYSPLAWSGPTRIPEIREAKSPVIVIPAHWVKNKDYLKRTAQVIARRYIKKEVSGYVYEKGVRPKGCLVFVVNSGECYVAGPYCGDNSNRQSFIYAELKKPGWIFVSLQSVSVEEV